MAALRSTCALLVGLLAFVAVAAPPKSPLCRRLARLLEAARPHGVPKGIVYGEQSGGEEIYLNLDVDNDGRRDKLVRSCSASIVPSDPCLLQVELASGFKYEVEAWRMYLLAFEKHTYVVASDIATSGEAGPRNVLVLGTSRAKLVCTGI